MHMCFTSLTNDRDTLGLEYTGNKPIKTHRGGSMSSSLDWRTGWVTRSQGKQDAGEPGAGLLGSVFKALVPGQITSRQSSFLCHSVQESSSPEGAFDWLGWVAWLPFPTSGRDAVRSGQALGPLCLFRTTTITKTCDVSLHLPCPKGKSGCYHQKEGEWRIKRETTHGQPSPCNSSSASGNERSESIRVVTPVVNNVLAISFLLANNKDNRNAHRRGPVTESIVHPDCRMLGSHESQWGEIILIGNL